MSARQQAREQRKQSFWEQRYDAAEQRGGRSVAWVAFSQLGAAVASRPAGERDSVWRWLAQHLIELATKLTNGELHEATSQTKLTAGWRSTRPAALRARARDGKSNTDTESEECTPLFPLGRA